MNRNEIVRLFGAFIEPQGVHAVEYEREANGISVLRHLADATASEAVEAEDHHIRRFEEPSFMRPFDRKEIPS